MAFENIKTLSDLNAEIADKKASLALQETLLEHKWQQMPAESIKASAGFALPFIIKRLISNTSTNIIADVFGLFVSRKRSAAKKAIGGTVKRIGLITLLKTVANNWVKKKYSSPR